VSSAELNVGFFDSVLRTNPDVVVVRARIPRLVFELRVMGEGVWSPVLYSFPQN